MLSKRFALNKLGRDNIVELFEEDGCKVKFHLLTERKEIIKALREKVIEELDEVVTATTHLEVESEFADVEEALDALKRVLKAPQEHIDAHRALKKLQKGSFEKLVYLDSVEVPENSKYYQHYLDHPEKYPELP